MYYTGIKSCYENGGGAPPCGTPRNAPDLSKSLCQILKLAHVHAFKSTWI